MQAASHTCGSFSKVTFPDNNSDVTELLAPLAFKLSPLCESFHTSKIFGIWKITLRFPPREKEKFRKHCTWLSTTRDENSLKVTQTMRHLQRFSVTNHLHLNTYTNKTSQGLYLWQSEIGRNVPNDDAVNCYEFSHGMTVGWHWEAVPLQARRGPEVSRKLRFPDYMTTAQVGGKVVSLTHRPPLPPWNTPGTHFC